MREQIPVSSGRVPIVKEYWAGVLQRLEAEVHVFSDLIVHMGERGRENEAVLVRILSAFVPQRYGVGSGLLISTRDEYSNQTDIVLYDQSDEPAVLAQTTQVLFPIENVLACVEVKTTLRAADLDDCFGKAKRMREMHTARRHPDGTRHPLFVVLAYKSGISDRSVAEKLASATSAERPDLLCVVERGLLAGEPGVLLPGSTSPSCGLALVQQDGSPVESEPEDDSMRASHAGRRYPVVSFNGRLVLCDAPRALLLFVEALVRILAQQQCRSEPVVTHYVTDDLRTLAAL